MIELFRTWTQKSEETNRRLDKCDNNLDKGDSNFDRVDNKVEDMVKGNKNI